MVDHYRRPRMILRGFALIALCVAVATPALAATTPDLSGSWLGSFKVKGMKGSDSKGVIGFNFTQTVDHGTFEGMSTTRGSKFQTTFDGTFALDGRKLTGSITATPDGEPPVTGSLVGKCNKKGKKIKLIAYFDDGSKVKIRMLKFF
jgi:hypothetical protein